MYLEVKDFLINKLFLSYSAQVQALCRALFSELAKLGLDYRIHTRGKDFVLWPAVVIGKRKVNRDFLTVYPRRDYLLLCPKFYGLPWKSEESQKIQKKIYTTKIESDYLELIASAYKSICNEDTSYIEEVSKKKNGPSELKAGKRPAYGGALPGGNLKDKFLKFYKEFGDSTFTLLLNSLQLEPSLVLREGRSLLERLLKRFYKQRYGHSFNGPLVDLIRKYQQQKIFSPRVISLMHTVRVVGNSAVHSSTKEKRVREEAMIILQAITIICEEILEKQMKRT